MKTLKNKLLSILLVFAVFAFAVGFVSIPKQPTLVSAAVVKEGMWVEDGASVNLGEEGRLSVRWVGAIQKDFMDNNVLSAEAGATDKKFGIEIGTVNASGEYDTATAMRIPYSGDLSFATENAAQVLYFAQHIEYTDLNESLKAEAVKVPLTARPYYYDLNGSLKYGNFDDSTRSPYGVAVDLLVNNVYGVGGILEDSYKNGRVKEYLPATLVANIESLQPTSLYAYNGQSLVVDSGLESVANVLSGAKDITSVCEDGKLAVTLTGEAGDNYQYSFIDASNQIKVVNYTMADLFVNGDKASGVSIYDGDQAEITIGLTAEQTVVPQLTVVSGPVAIKEDTTNVIVANGTGNAVVKAVIDGKEMLIEFEVTAIEQLENSYIFSAVDGLLFDGANPVSLADIGITDEIVAVKTESGAAVNYADGAIVGYKTGIIYDFIEDTLYVYTDSAKYALSVDVATLVIDEAIDMKYFSYTGTWTMAEAEALGYTNTYNAAEKHFAWHVNNPENGEIDQFNWEGYFYLVKDIDGELEGYGSTANPHVIYGNAGVTTFAANVNHFTGKYDIAEMKDAETISFVNLDNNNGYHNVFASGFANGQRGLTGTFEGNGHTISNFRTGLGGLFGFIRDAKVQNLGLDGVDMFASTAMGANEFTNIYYRSTAANSSFARSMSKLSTITNVYIEVPNFLPQQHASYSIIGNEELSYGYNYLKAESIADKVFYDEETGDPLLPSTTNLIVVSPVSSGVRKVGWNQTRYYIDGETVDGVPTSQTNTYSFRPHTLGGAGSIAEYQVYLLAGSTRYTSTATLAAAYNANAGIYDGFSAEFWHVENGLIKFGAASTIDVYANAVLVEDSLSVGEGETIELSAICGGINQVPTLSVEENSFVSVSGNRLTGLSVGSQIISVEVGNLTKQINVKVVAPPIVYEKELLFSAHDGILFDEQTNEVIALTDIAVDEEIASASTLSGASLQVENGALLGYQTGEINGFVEDTLYIQTEFNKYIVSVKVATLIIDQAQDMSYFTYQGDYVNVGATETTFTQYYKEAQIMMWDGFYYMVKDIDGELEGYGSTANPHNLAGQSGVALGDMFVAINAFGETGYSANYAHWWSNSFENIHRGLLGTFDGNGHTISNFTTTYSIFGAIQKDAVVKNLGLVDVSTTSVQYNAPALAQAATGTATFNNVYFDSTNSNAGGFVTHVGDNVSMSNVFMVVGNSITGSQHGLTLGGPVNNTHNSYLKATISNLIIVSNKPLSIDASARYNWTSYAITTDAAVVDGNETANVLDETSGVYLTKNTTSNVYHASTGAIATANNGTHPYSYQVVHSITRYTTTDKIANAYNKDSSIYGGFSADMWHVENGVLRFGAVNTISAYVGGQIVDGPIAIIAGDSVEVSARRGGIDQESILSADENDIISISGNTVTGLTVGTQVVTVAVGNLTTQVTINVLPAPVDYEEELLFSAEDGLFFDGNGNVVTLQDIFGTDSMPAITLAQDSSAKTLAVDAQTGAITGVASGKDDFVNEVFTIGTEEKIYRISVKVATLILDEVSDLNYFVVTTNSTNAYWYKLPDGQFEFGGYYHQVKNLVDTSLNLDVYVNTTKAPEFGYAYSHEADLYPNKGLTGTYNGNGFSIEIGIPTYGLFPLINGGTVKNLAYYAQTNCGISTMAMFAQYIVGNAIIQDVYMKDVRSAAMSGWNNGIFARATGLADTVTVENVLIEYPFSTINGSAANRWVFPYNQTVIDNAENLLIVTEMAVPSGLTMTTEARHFYYDVNLKNAYTEDNSLYDGFNMDIWTITADGMLVFDNSLAVNTSATEYLFSEYDGLFFDEQTGDVVAIEEVIGTNSAITAVVDANNNDVWDEANSRISGVTVAKTGFVENSFVITVADGMKYKVYVKVAKLIIDEAEDMKFFSYDGNYNADGSVESPTSDGLHLYIWQNEKGQNKMRWTDYYYLIKDIDGASSTYGNAENPHTVFGDTGVAPVTDKWDIITAESLTSSSSWDKVWSNNRSKLDTENSLGFFGTFDGNGHTISNFTTDTSGLFGAIKHGTIKNVGIVNVDYYTTDTLTSYNYYGSLAHFMYGADSVLSNIYYQAGATGYRLVGSIDNDATVEDILHIESTLMYINQNTNNVIVGDRADRGYGDHIRAVDNYVYVSLYPMMVAYNADICVNYGALYAYGDAQYVDGQLVTTNDKIYGVWEDNHRQVSSAKKAYDVSFIVQGSSRFTSQAALTTYIQGAGGDSIVAGFDSGFWTIDRVNGTITFGE